MGGVTRWWGWGCPPFSLTRFLDEECLSPSLYLRNGGGQHRGRHRGSSWPKTCHPPALLPQLAGSSRSVDGVAMPATAEQVRRARRKIIVLESMGLSLSEIARRAGCSPSTVTRLANGSSKPSMPLVRAILAVRPR